MAVQKLVLDPFEDDYELIAIHCSLESYRLAFSLNKFVNLRLKRKQSDIHFQYKESTASFPFFQYKDPFKYTTYSLVKNKFKSQVTEPIQAQQGLFAEPEKKYVTKYLLPEVKNVDYLLKIETDVSELSSKLLLHNLQQIPQLVTAYMVDYTNFKSKNNLIFE